MFKSRFSLGFRILTTLLLIAFVQEIFFVDIQQLKAEAAAPAKLLLPSDTFIPSALKAIRVNPQKPFEIDFLVDAADEGQTQKDQVARLIKYFLAVLTTPERDLWVNLSPHEKNRTIVPQFGETAAGRELLSQDAMLKRLAASLTYPETRIGQDFWQRVFAKAQKMYGTSEVPVDTFQRVWITPAKAVVYEYDNVAFVTESHLKVLLDEDYYALKNIPVPDQKSLGEEDKKRVSNISAAITREIILPEIEKEINEGKNFASLRQIFHALILATWFKKRLHSHALSKVYADQKKVKGIEDRDPEKAAERIYEGYMQTFRDGVYNYVREDYDPTNELMITRQYFSGGFSAGKSEEWLIVRKISFMMLSTQEFLKKLGRKLQLARVELLPLNKNGQMRRWATGMIAGGMLALSAGANAYVNPAPMTAPLMAPTAQVQMVEPNNVSGWVQEGPQEEIIVEPVESNQSVQSEPLMEIEEDQVGAPDVVVTPLETVPAVQGIELNVEQKIATPESETKQYVQKLKEKITLEDVKALDGQVNPQTGKVYEIDADYFKANWYRVFDSADYGWAQKTLVIAYQHKMGLVEDGIIGKVTKRTLDEPTTTSPKIVSPLSRDQFVAGAGNPPPKSAYPEITLGDSTPAVPLFVSPGPTTSELPSAVQSPPAPVHSVGHPLLEEWKLYKDRAFEILAVLVLTPLGIRIYRDSRQSANDRTGFLKNLTSALRQSGIMGPKVGFTDLSASNGKKTLIVLRSNMLLGDKDKRETQVAKTLWFFRNMMQRGDLRVMYGTEELSLESVEIYNTRMHLLFRVPEDISREKKISLWYRGNDGQLKNVEQSLVNDPSQELRDGWRELLQQKEPWTDQEVLNLIREIRAFRDNNPFAFKDFRNWSSTIIETRRLVLQTIERLQNSPNARSDFQAYFGQLLRYNKMIYGLAVPSATLDTYKSSFLPEKDNINFKILGLSLDKVLRVLLLEEYVYNRSRRIAHGRIPQYQQELKRLDRLERDLFPEEKLAAEKTTVDTLRQDFDQYSMSLEKPYNNSLLGIDLWRRHNKLFRSFLIVAIPIWLLWSSGASIGLFWVPLAVWLVDYAVMRWIIPTFMVWLSQREYERFDAGIPQIPVNMQEIEGETASVKSELLAKFTADFLPVSRWRKFLIVLNATRFFDVTAVRENSYVEMRFMSDSQFLAQNGQGKELLKKLEQSVRSGTLSFWLDGKTVVPAEQMTITLHPTGIRLKLKNVPSSVKAVTVRYQETEVSVKLKADKFKMLINQWEHVLEDPQRSTEDLRELVALISDFVTPRNLRLSDFRSKNAGYYYEIREHALRLYEILARDRANQNAEFGNYFLELANYATEVRDLMAHVAGLDALKSRFLPDGSGIFRLKPFGVPFDSILRAVFGVTFLYRLTRSNARKAIHRVALQALQLNQAAQGLVRSVAKVDESAFEQHLNQDLQQIDFSYRYPARDSLVSRDRYHRQQRLGVMSFYLFWLSVSLALLIIPYIFVGINLLLAPFGLDPLAAPDMLGAAASFQVFGLTLVNTSIILYMIVYWINPIRAYNDTQREYVLNHRKILAYKSKTNHSEGMSMMEKFKSSGWNDRLHYLFYGVSLYEPFLILIAFFGYEFRYWYLSVTNKKKATVPVDRLEQEKPTAPETRKDVVGGPPRPATASSPLQKGGIDLDDKNYIEYRSGSGQPAWRAEMAPEAVIPEIDGMDFKVLELTPIINLHTFIPNFVKMEGNDQLLSSLK